MRTFGGCSLVQQQKLIVSKVIAGNYGEFPGKNACLLPAMFPSPPEKIWSLLDRMGIPEDDT